MTYLDELTLKELPNAFFFSTERDLNRIINENEDSFVIKYYAYRELAHRYLLEKGILNG